MFNLTWWGDVLQRLDGKTYRKHAFETNHEPHSYASLASDAMF
jgi:hypothetical protein